MSVNWAGHLCLRQWLGARSEPNYYFHRFWLNINCNPKTNWFFFYFSEMPFSEMLIPIAKYRQFCRGFNVLMEAFIFRVLMGVNTLIYTSAYWSIRGMNGGISAVVNQHGICRWFGANGPIYNHLQLYNTKPSPGSGVLSLATILLPVIRT